MSKVITVFGATGSQGGSVLRALVNSDKFHIRAITRNAKSDKAKHLAELKNVTVQEADLNNRASLDKSLKGSYGVFLVTDLAIDPKAPSESQQGINLIDSSIKNKVSHLVFSGLENIKTVIGKPCLHFDNKEMIESYGMMHRDKLNFTSIRMPAFYQVLTTMMLKQVKPNEFISTLPMSDKPMYAMNVEDLGACVSSIFNQPNEFKSKIVEVAGDHLKGADYVDLMNKHLKPNKFAYANISLPTFASWGLEEFAHMFEYYQTGKMTRDLNLTKKLNPNTLTFNDWLAKNKESILKGLPKA